MSELTSQEAVVVQWSAHPIPYSLSKVSHFTYSR